MKTKLFTLLFILLLPVLLIAQDSTQTKISSYKDSTDFKFKYYIASGVYFPDVNTEIRIDSKQFGLGTVLSLEKSLQFPDKPTLFRIDAFARITKRSAFTANYFLMNRNSTITVEKEINIADTTIEVGATLHSKINNSYYGLTYHYDVFRKPMVNAGFDVGLSCLLWDMGFDIKRLNGEGRSYSENLPVPVILIGLHTYGYFTPRLRAGYRFEFFRLSIDGVKGSVYDNKFMLEYYFLKNLALGLSYNSITYDLDDFPVSKNFTGKINFQISGMELYLSARF